MRLVFDRSAFRSALAHAAKAMPANKASKPVLQNLLVEAAPDAPLAVSGTDTKLGVRVLVRGIDCQEPGRALLPAALLLAMLDASSDERMLLSCPPGADAELSGLLSPTFFSLPAADPSAFPTFAGEAAEAHAAISAGALRELLKRTAFAAADDETRYSMTGVMLEFGKDDSGKDGGPGLRAVATDGRRLAVATAIAAPAGGHGGTGLAPAKAVKVLSGLLDDPEEEVCISLLPNELVLSAPRASLRTLLVEGRFPDWRGVLPNRFPASVRLNAGSFAAAVRQAGVAAPADARRVLCAFADGVVRVSAEGAAKSRAQAPLEGHDGPPLPEGILFNPDYLLEWLRVVPPASTVEVRLDGAKRPSLLSCGDDCRYLAMPIT